MIYFKRRQVRFIVLILNAQPVQSPTKPKKLHLKEVPPAHKKIGHLKVDKDGEIMYKKVIYCIEVWS